MVASSHSTFTHWPLTRVLPSVALAIVCCIVARADNADTTKQVELGYKLRQQGHFTDAIRLMDKALSSNPNSVACLLLRAGVYEEMGNIKAACADAKKVSLIEPKSSTHRARVAYYVAKLGRLSDGLAMCNQALASDPHCAAAYSIRSSIHRLQPGHTAQALADAARAMQLSPSVPNYPTAYAYILADLKKPQQALAVLNKVLKSHKDFLPALCLRAQLEFDAKQFDLAEKDWAMACASSPGDPGSLSGYGNCLDRRKKYAEAIDLYTKALQNNPNQISILQKRAYDYAYLNKPDQGIADLEQALAVIASDPYKSNAVETSFLLTYFDFLSQFRQWEKGAAVCTDKLKTASLAPEQRLFFRKQHSRFQFLLENYPAALKELAALNQNGKISLKDPFDSIYVLVLDASGRPQEALAQCKSLAKLNPSPLMMQMLDRLKRARTKPGETLDSLDALIGLRPDSRELHEDRAGLLIKQSKYDKALAEYDLLIKTWPAHSKQYRTRKAKLYEVLGKDALALEEYNRMIEKCTDDPALFVSRAAIYKRLGDDQRSKRDRGLADALMSK